MPHNVPPTTMKRPNQDQTTSNTTTIVYPFEYVEGLLAQCLGSMFHAIEPLKPETHSTLSMTKLDNIRASASLVYLEARETLDCLNPYHDASLNPKHRMIRTMLRCVANELESSALAKARSTRHSACLAYARLASDTLTTFHKLLHSSTPLEDREATLLHFLLGHSPKSLLKSGPCEGLAPLTTP